MKWVYKGFKEIEPKNKKGQLNGINYILRLDDLVIVKQNNKNGKSNGCWEDHIDDGDDIGKCFVDNDRAYGEAVIYNIINLNTQNINGL